jgi:hypothetical protein
LPTLLEELYECANIFYQYCWHACCQQSFQNFIWFILVDQKLSSSRDIIVASLRPSEWREIKCCLNQHHQPRLHRHPITHHQQ